MKLLLVPVFLFFTGCSILAPTYDNNEYIILVDISVTVQNINSQCLKSDRLSLSQKINGLVSETQRFELYTRHLANSDDIHNVASIVNKDAMQMSKFYATKGHNEKYCLRKTDMMGKKVNALLPVLATKRR